MSQPNEDSENPAPTIGDLQREKLELEVQLKKKQLESLGKAPAAKKWWAVAIEFLGLPAAVIGLAVAFTTAVGNYHSDQKTVAETAQIKANLAKAADAGKLANDLTAKEKEGPEAFDKAVLQNADKIKDALKSFQQAEEQAAKVNIQRSVLKFVLLWVLFNVVNLVFDVLGQGWRTATATLFYAVSAWLIAIQERYYREPNDGRPRRRLRWIERLQRIAPGFQVVLGPLPDILRWSIQLSIFATLLGPLFNEIAASFGSSITFADILREAEHLHFGATLSLMHQLLFGS
jgi:hypothetical protein